MIEIISVKLLDAEMDQIYFKYLICNISSIKSQRDNKVYNNNIEIKNNKIALLFCEKYISIEYKIFLFLQDIFEKLMNTKTNTKVAAQKYLLILIY